MENYEHINLDEYTLSGEGGTALSYTHKDGKTLKKNIFGLVIPFYRSGLSMGRK